MKTIPQPKIIDFDTWFNASDIQEKCKHCKKKLTHVGCSYGHDWQLKQLYNTQVENDKKKWQEYHQLV